MGERGRECDEWWEGSGEERRGSGEEREGTGGAEEGLVEWEGTGGSGVEWVGDMER
jgi:hypothetical protein